MGSLSHWRSFQKIAQSGGDFLPATAERSYNVALPTPRETLDRLPVFADRGIVANQLSSGLRIGGWGEYAPLYRPANQTYFESIARISTELFPTVNFENTTFWKSNRPSKADSVTVISEPVRRIELTTIEGIVITVCRLPTVQHELWGI